MTRIGFVTLVGAGPGDPNLLTLAGLKALQEADCVVYDRLVSQRLLEWAPPEAERIYVGKEAGAGAHCASQETINKLLLDGALKGQRVVRLKGGDPLLFGRGGEELEALSQAGVPFAVVPGVTAALAASAFTGAPLTHRLDSSAVAFVTGHEDPRKSSGLNPEALAKFPGTLAVYMPLKRASAFAAALIANGKPPETPALFVEWASTNGQRTVETTLGALVGPDALKSPIAELKSPTLAIIGGVCKRRQSIKWFEKRPLFGTGVLILRPAHQAGELVERLEELGARVWSSPAFDILPPESWTEVDRAILRLPEFAWVVFTSRNGVEHLLNRVWETGGDLRVLGGRRIAVIGPGTARALEEFRVRPDLIPDEFRSEALADALAPMTAGKKVLLVRADRGRDELRRRLELKSQVETVVAYRQVDRPQPTEEARNAIERGEVQWVVFTSSNTAAAFWNWRPAFTEAAWARLRFATISPVTSEAVERLGGQVAAEAKVYTMEGVAEALQSAVTSSSDGVRTTSRPPDR